MEDTKVYRLSVNREGNVFTRGVSISVKATDSLRRQILPLFNYSDEEEGM